VNRREFITLLGSGAVAWPLVARAQQGAMPVIGFFDTHSPEATADRLRAFHRGLKESGYVESENVVIAYRWDEGQNERLPELAAELVRRQVAVTFGFGGQSGNHDNPYCVRRSRGPSQARSCREPCPPGRQCDGDQLFQR